MSKPLQKTYQHVFTIPDTQPINTRVYFKSLNNLTGKKILGIRFDRGDDLVTGIGDLPVAFTYNGINYDLIGSLIGLNITLTLQKKDGAYSIQDLPISSCSNFGLAAPGVRMMREPFFPIEGIYDFDNSYITIIQTLAAAPGGLLYALALNFKYED